MKISYSSCACNRLTNPCDVFRELNDFVLPVGLEYVPDILAFGTQESCSEKFDWESSLQETLGPSHVLFHSTSLGNLKMLKKSRLKVMLKF